MKENVKDEGDLQVYEIGYHLLPTISEENVSGEVSKIHSLIGDKGGSIVSDAFPAMRTLAYDITKKIDTKNVHFNRAYFGWVKFEVEREAMEAIQKEMEANPGILRYLAIKTVKENTLYTPKAPIFKKENGVEEKTEGTEVAPVSEEEIDKSIDELVSNQTL